MKTKNGSASSVVVGLGEVGAALREVLGCDGHDPFKGIVAKGHYEYVHIAFPYNDETETFAAEVNKYKNMFTPTLTIIHSTVPIGTSRTLDAVHSPVRGVHPNLAHGIRTFVKFFGGERAEEAAHIFEKRGVRTYITDRPEETEAGKLWDTTQYGALILLNKEIYSFCQANNLNFHVVYQLFNQTYNDGYRALGRPEVVRPYLKYVQGPIGGHCVLPNARLLNSQTAERIIKENSKLWPVKTKPAVKQLATNKGRTQSVP